jgi:hypothetical protein
MTIELKSKYPIDVHNRKSCDEPYTGTFTAALIGTLEIVEGRVVAIHIGGIDKTMEYGGYRGKARRQHPGVDGQPSRRRSGSDSALAASRAGTFRLILPQM